MLLGDINIYSDNKKLTHRMYHANIHICNDSDKLTHRSTQSKRHISTSSRISRSTVGDWWCTSFYILLQQFWKFCYKYIHRNSYFGTINLLTMSRVRMTWGWWALRTPKTWHESGALPFPGCLVSRAPIFAHRRGGGSGRGRRGSCHGSGSFRRGSGWCSRWRGSSGAHGDRIWCGGWVSEWVGEWASESLYTQSCDAHAGDAYR